jgi:hypothetical protein
LLKRKNVATYVVVAKSPFVYSLLLAAPFGPSKKVRKLYYVKWTNMEYAESTWEYLSSGGRAGSFYNAYLKDSEVDFAGVARLEEQLVVLYKAFLSHMAVQDTPGSRM